VYNKECQTDATTYSYEEDVNKEQDLPSSLTSTAETTPMISHIPMELFSPTTTPMTSKKKERDYSDVETKPEFVDFVKNTTLLIERYINHKDPLLDYKDLNSKSDS